MLEAFQHLSGRGGAYDLALADSYAAGATFFALLTGSKPVLVAEQDMNDDAAWEAALLRRVRAGYCASEQTLPWLSQVKYAAAGMLLRPSRSV